MNDLTGVQRIIMVCMGNICRSPAAEVVLRHMLQQAGLHHITVDSAGTGGWHEGDGADPRSQAAWERRGYAHRHRARQFRSEWFEERDLILVMDEDNHATLASRTRNDAHRAKIRYLRSFDPLVDDLQDAAAMEVPDPYYGGIDGFEHMLDLIERSCAGLIAELQRPQR